MNESVIGTMVFSQFILIFIGALFYMLGGRRGKWKRRFIAPIFQAGAVVVGLYLLGLYSYYHLLLLPFLVFIYSLGYGDSKKRIVPARLFIGFLMFTCPLVLFYLTLGAGVLLILPIHLAFILFAIYIGSNPVFPAAVEETVISIMFTMPWVFYTSLSWF